MRRRSTLENLRSCGLATLTCILLAGHAVPVTAWAVQSVTDSGTFEVAPGVEPQAVIEPPTVNRPPLDVQQAIQMAVENDPEFQQIHWAIEKACGQQFQATRYPNPTAGVTGDEIGNDGSAGLLGVFWSQNVVRNNRQAIQHRYYSMEIAALQQRYDIRRWELAREMGTRFLRATMYHERCRIIEQQIAALEEIQEITQRLFTAGEISNIAVSNIKLELESVKQELRESRLRQEFELKALAVPLGIRSETGTWQPADIDLNWTETTMQLMDSRSTIPDENWFQSHPQISYANTVAEQSRIQIELAQSQQCPDLQVQGRLGIDTFTDDVFAGFQVGVPLLKHDRKNGLIRAANSEFMRRQEEVRSREMRLRTAAMTAQGELAGLRSRVTNIRDVIIPQADSNLRQIRSAFEIGEAEFLLLKTGIDAVRDSQLRLIQAEFELAVAAVNLKTLLVDEN